MAAPLINLSQQADMAAWLWLWQQISSEERDGFNQRLQPGPSPVAPSPAVGTGSVGSHIPTAVAFIRHPGIEGCHLQSYPDPETKGDPWTIGWGNTMIDGRRVRPGNRITQAQADALLVDTVEALETVLAREVPTWSLLNGHQQAALLSFAFNNGAWFMRSGRHQTIAAALREGRLLDVPNAMALYVNPGGPTEAGLRKRRRLEGAIWHGGWAAMLALEQAMNGQPKPFRVVKPEQQAFVAETLRKAAPPRTPGAGGFVGPTQEPQHYKQMDSEVPGQAPRSCFSSSCAMLLKRVLPNALMGSNADDDYLRRVLSFGDTIHPAAQLQALASYGVQARWIQNGNWDIFEQQCRRGFGAALGYVHNGPVDGPWGSGHWCYGWGLDATHALVHDPMGEADMVAGGFVPGRSGRAVRYTRRNFSRRWEVVGPPWRHAPGNGWMIVVDGVNG